MKKKSEKNPIMSEDQERFMAFEGLVQWTAGTISQGKRLAEGRINMLQELQNDETRRLAGTKMQTEYHYFSLTAHKLLEHVEWVLRLGLCKNVDFSMLDEFSKRDVRDLRNMREHIVDYFEGKGRDKERWKIETPEYSADASGIVGDLIGGRLNWVRFAAAAEILLPVLLAEPIPYPSASRPIVPSSDHK
jgi:hypothetical protein